MSRKLLDAADQCGCCCCCCCRPVLCRAVLMIMMMQSQLLSGMVGRLDGVMEYGDSGVRTTAAKLLQYVRSMPGVTAAIVGQKVRQGRGREGGRGRRGPAGVDEFGHLLQLHRC